MFTKVSIATLFAGLAAAQLHPPVGNTPSGNSISRPLNEVVPACVPFTITWKPSTPNTVSVLLLKGPSTNVVKFGPSLAEGIANSGSLQWTPASDLEATAGPNGYGIQIIDDVTGQYQYSTQFGISKGSCGAVSSVKPSSTGGSNGYPVSTPAAPKSSSSTGYYTATVIASAIGSSAPVYSTGAPMMNSTLVIQPTKSLSVPSSLKASATGPAATTSKLPEVTGAASALQAGAGVLGAVAAFAFML